MRLGIYNSGWEQIDSCGDLDNDDGLTEKLKTGETYYIRVEQYNNLGSYTLNIGRKKDIADITNYTSVSDSMQYTLQENDYSYTAESERRRTLFYSGNTRRRKGRLYIILWTLMQIFKERAIDFLYCPSYLHLTVLNFQLAFKRRCQYCRKIYSRFFSFKIQP